MSKILSGSDLEESSAIYVVSNAQKWVFMVPVLEKAEPLVYPKGHEKEGQAVSDWEGKPIGDSGVIFYNGVDRVVQAVKGDGTGIVIINEVKTDQAQRLDEVASLIMQSGSVGFEEVKEILAVATCLGLTDQYNSDIDFMNKKLTAVSSDGSKKSWGGLMKRDDRDLCKAWKMETSGVFAGPSADPQEYKAGDYIVKVGEVYAKVDAAVFARTYMNPDGSKIEVEVSPTVSSNKMKM